MGMLKNGVPLEAILCRLEQGIDDLCLADRMMNFVDVFHKELFKPERGPEIICVDGKAMRGTVQKDGRNPDIVSAYLFNTGITLATEACPEKSNEIRAVPILLDKPDIAGQVITANTRLSKKSKHLFENRIFDFSLQ